MLDFRAKPKCLMEPLRHPPIVRFGTYEVALHSGELRKAGVKIRVQQQPMKLLETLLERPGVESGPTRVLATSTKQSILQSRSSAVR